MTYQIEQSIFCTEKHEVSLTGLNVGRTTETPQPLVNKRCYLLIFKETSRSLNV